MLSIIVCSINPEYLSALQQNIAETIGTEYEIIPIDNRECNWPIAKAYNHGAKQAKYPFLFFAHEDIKFHTKEWGPVIEDKLKEQTTGIIGFAGSKARVNTYAAWFQERDWMVLHLYQRAKNLTKLDISNVYLEVPFIPVTTIDGLGMFVRADVWAKLPFDESVLQGFHCYDIDFSLQIFTHKYVNYVCTSNDVWIEHFSHGNYDTEWISETVRLHRKKWKYMLPLMVSDMNMSSHELKEHEEYLAYKFLIQILWSDYQKKQELINEFFWKRKWNSRHFANCITLYSMIKKSKRK